MHKQVLTRLGVIIAIAFLAFGLYLYQLHRIDTDTEIQKQRNVYYGNTPTLFIHGYQGNLLSFGPMINDFDYNQIAKKQLTIRVSGKGKLSVTGKLSPKKENPMILLLFENNTADEITQSRWIDQVMVYLKKQGVQKVNVVAHSMGGVSALRYLLEYADDRTPVTERLAVIGSPFNDLEIAEDTEEIFSYELTGEGPISHAPIYQYFDRQMNQLPRNMHILNIAGDLDNGTKSDGSVSLDSAFSLRFLLQKHVNSYREVVIKGEQAEHSALTKNPRVENQIKQFLW